MFEISFNEDLKNRGYLDFLYSNLKDEIKKCNAVVAHQVCDDRVFLSFACEDCFAADFKCKTVDLLAEIFVFGYKYDYLKNNLYIYKENLLIKTVINAMTIFDSQNDKKLIKKELFNQQVGALDGFFNFRLKKIKEKWNEIIDLVNENSIVLSDNDVAYEFLAFLIQSLPNAENLIEVLCKNKQFVLLLNGNKVDISVPFGKDGVDEEVVLYNLIKTLPKRIVIKNKHDFSDEFLSIIEKCF